MISEAVVLSGIEPEDIPQIVAWRNRPDISDSFIEYEPLTNDAQLRFLTRMDESKDRKLWLINARDPNRAAPYAKVVRPTPDAIPVGTIGLKDIDMRNRHCELASMFIAELDYRNFQVAFDAEWLVLDYCFNHLGMHKVIAWVPAYNTDVAKLHLVMGWKKEGVLREQVLKKGKFEDVTLLAIFSDEFAKRFSKRLKEAGAAREADKP
ncbi:MAG: diamine N-acetyltransferase [Chloroflexota bacterium]|nr:diamine N-acetyltransferase [Chloroflexota bacterium]